jgi:D-methionine transport system substrate-binding protein
MFRYIKLLIIAFALICVSACQKEEQTNSIRIGTISGPETQLMEVAKKVAYSKYGLDIKIVEFTDYMEPNIALNDGSIDINMFQHQPYLTQQMKDHKYKLVAVGNSFIYPMGIYSSKIKSVKDLPQNPVIAIANDPSNEARALLLLQKAGLIKLKPNVGLYATPEDVVSNPKNIKFRELDAALIARTLPDVDAAALNSNYALTAGLSPKKDAIFLERNDSPYMNIFVVREDKVNDPRVKQLIASFQSQEVKEAAKEIFNGEAIAGW